MNKGKIFVISGPSGAGKSTLVDRVLSNKELNLCKIPTYTTRDKRDGEVHEKDYCFIDHDSFKKFIESGEVVEYNFYNGHFYGTPKSHLEKNLEEANVILVIDVHGAKNIKEKFSDKCKLVFIKTKPEELRRRLLSRGSHTPEAIEERIGRAEYEISFADTYDHVVENSEGKLEATVKELERILKK